jgi:hypothetical protein
VNQALLRRIGVSVENENSFWHAHKRDTAPAAAQP